MNQVTVKDEIVIDAPTGKIWSILADSSLLPKFASFVKKVEFLDATEGHEKLGSRRKCYLAFGNKSGYQIERRSEEIPRKKISFTLEEESLGMSKVVSDWVGTFDLESLGPTKTKTILSLKYHPKGLFGKIMNAIMMKSRNRTAIKGFLEGLKQYAETK